jgi:hypothetical protein
MNIFAFDQNKNNFFIIIGLDGIRKASTANWVSMFGYKGSATKVIVFSARFRRATNGIAVSRCSA